MCGVFLPGSGPNVESSGTSVVGSNCCNHRKNGRNFASRLDDASGLALPPCTSRAHCEVNSEVTVPKGFFILNEVGKVQYVPFT